MVDGTSDDDIIRERVFRISDKLDLGDLVDDSKFIEVKEAEDDSKGLDDAIGEVFDPFLKRKALGSVERDGTVKTAPEKDIVTEIATEGERRINWILMGSMILVYSAIGFLIGFVFEPLVATISLVVLSSIGFLLGERWSKDGRLRILGVTWVIISMKVLYGLSIELQRWGVIEVEGLGALLLVTVGLNIVLSYRYDHDAIAAQSTLVLLAVGSTAGSLYGQQGVAIMILISTILMHVLAGHRKSGNLAALGIASSNLWIGMHAITGGFEIGELKVLALDSPLLLFVLMMGITGLNAGMATRFAREDNWFSKGVKILGLGKPGLWGVSVSLGLLGALLAVAANRGDVGYALGMVTVLCGAFSGSYLVVRGVSWERVSLPLVMMAMILLLGLIFGNEVASLIGFSEYTLFAIFGSATVAFVILRDQNSVSDRVLWMGTVAVLALLVILVPSESNEAGGDGGVLLLSMLSLLHIGSGVLAIKRKSPSLAGVTVLLPWSWIILEQLVQETLRTLLMSNNFDDPGSIIHIDSFPLTGYLLTCTVMIAVVNEKMGKTDVNIASKFLGISEISASIRDSGALQLWSLGLWLPMASILFTAQFGAFTSPTLLLVSGLLWGLHLLAHLRGVRVGEMRLMVGIILLSGLLIQWRHGMGEYLTLFICLILVSILLSKREGEGFYTTSMGVMGVPLLLLIPDRNITMILEDFSFLPEIEPSVVALTSTATLLGVYLPRVGDIEDLLKPAISSLWLMTICIAVTYAQGDQISFSLSIGIFMIATVWLVARGELRRELQTVTKMSSRRALALENKSKSLGEGELRTYDAREAEMLSSRKKSREKYQTDDVEELYISDVSHRPVIIIAVMALIFATSLVIGFTSGPDPILLLVVGAFVTLLIAVARFRTRQLELDLPHILGIEMPIALAITGLVMVHIFSLLGPGASNENLTSMGVLVILVVELSLISLYQQDNMLDRIPIAIDWIIYPLLADRVLGAILYESMPWPLSVDPFSGELVEWKGPLMALEICLVGLVVISFWISNMRASKGRESESGFSLGFRGISVTILSVGFASIIVIITTLRNGWARNQSNAVGMGILSVALAIVSIESWFEGFTGIVGDLYSILGVALVILLVCTIPMNGERWSMMLAVNSHVLLILGLIISGSSALIPIFLMILSTSVWVTGILQLRKSMRAWGLADLSAAILFSIVFYGGVIFQAQILLIGLSVIALELGIVSWLGLRNEESMVNSRD